MQMIASMLIISSMVVGCSWLNDYGHCTAVWTCESCEDVKVTFEWVKQLDQKEASAP